MLRPAADSHYTHSDNNRNVSRRATGGMVIISAPVAFRLFVHGSMRDLLFCIVNKDTGVSLQAGRLGVGSWGWKHT